MTPTSVVAAVKRRLSPLDGVMSAAAYRRVLRTPPLQHGTTVVAGQPIAFSDAEGLLHSAREIFLDEVYRFDATSAAPRIIDAGANVGLSVLYFKRLYPAATVIAYEPDATIFGLLQRNVGQLPGVTLRQAAIWTEDTELTFYSEGSLAGSSEINFQSRGQAIKVRAERLRSELDKQAVDFLKIDVEGAENAVLFDIEDRLDRVANLFFEYHSVAGKGQRLGEMLELVTRKGFRYVINGPHGPRLPFVERVESGFDLQLNVSCYRA